MITRRVALQAVAGGTAGLLSGCLLGGESTTPVKTDVINHLEERIGVHLEIETEDGQTVFEQTVHAVPLDELADSDDRKVSTTVSDTYVVGQEYRFHVTIVDTDTYEEGKSTSERGCVFDREADVPPGVTRPDRPPEFSVRLRSGPDRDRLEILQYTPTC